jgi:starch-binding outer membrane protein, SusD/RagB family
MKSIKIIIFISILFTTIASCKKVIESSETDLIAGSTALKTVTNCEQAVIGAYGGFATEMDILLNATLSDEVKTAGEFYVAASTHEWTYSSTDVGIRDNFVAMIPQYRTIDRINRVLQALPVADSLLIGDNTKKLRLRGEALFLRAFCHFQLFRFYCGNYTATGLAMPYMETPSLNPQGRIIMSTYFQKMNADIAEAKTLLPNNLTDINRATVTAANGLQARIALYTNDWVNAEAYSTAYINALPLASKANFPGIWTDANTSEVAYQMIRNTGNRIGSLFRGTSSGPTAIGTVTWKPSDKLWSYLKNEPLLGAAVPARQTRLVYKYAGTTYGTTNENVNNAKVFRTGEMYLIRAEARAEQGKFSGANSAETDLNDLRAARINGYVNEVFASKQAAIDATMLERYKELAFEGHRFWDLKRRGLPVTRLAVDAPTPAATTLAAGSYLFLLPIPLTEMQANALLTQNPGY